MFHHQAHDGLHCNRKIKSSCANNCEDTCLLLKKIAPAIFNELTKMSEAIHSFSCKVFLWGGSRGAPALGGIETPHGFRYQVVLLAPHQDGTK